MNYLIFGYLPTKFLGYKYFKYDLGKTYTVQR